MTELNRIKNILKQTFQDTKLNMTVSPNDLYEFFLKKLQKLHLNEEYIINDNDFNVILKHLSRNTELKDYFDIIFTLRNKVESQLLNINYSILEQIYISRYNYLKMFDTVKSKHIQVSDEILEMESDLFKSIAFCRNLMLFVFNTTREVLEISTEVYYREPYCVPQSTYRQLESIKRISLRPEIATYLHDVITIVQNHDYQIMSLLELIQEQITVLILYYQNLGDDYKFNIVNENQIYQSYSMYSNNHDIEQRKEELKQLQLLLNQNK